MSKAAGANGAAIQWRKFAFFDKEVVEQSVETLTGSQGPPTCVNADGGMVVFGDSSGHCTLLDRQLKIDYKIKAFRGEVRDVCYLFDHTNANRRQYIVCAGDDAIAGGTTGGPNYAIKIFVIKHSNLSGDKRHAVVETPRPLHVCQITGVHPLPIGATLMGMAVLKDALQIAVSFSTGTVLYFTGNFLKDSTGAGGRQPVPQVLSSPVGREVTGLYYAEVISTKTTDRLIRLFVVYDTFSPADGAEAATTASGDDLELLNAGIVVFDTSCSLSPGGIVYTPAANRRRPLVLDEMGALRRCCSLMRDTSELIVSRAEGIFTYSVDGRGGAAGIEGKKVCVSAVGRHILVAGVDEKTKRNSIVVYDLRNRVTSLSTFLPPGDVVTNAVYDSGVAYLVTKAMSLIVLKEKSTASKVDVLLKKSLFHVAIALAAEEQMEIGEIMKLYKAYGDHLYKRCEFDLAMKQYCHTIGYIQSSYVIRKYLEPRKLESLIEYLERVHARGLAISNHSTLLLILYTSMNKKNEISSFCDKYIRNGNNSYSNLNDNINALSGNAVLSSNFDDRISASKFNVNEAIDILSKAGLVDEASKMALQFKCHTQYINLQFQKQVVVSDIADTSDDNALLALGYFASLFYDSSTTNETINGVLNSCGRQLMGRVPDEFTALLIKLAIGEFSSLLPESSSSSASISSHVKSFAVDDLLFIFPNHDGHLKMLLEAYYDFKTSNHTHSFNPSSNSVNPLSSRVLLTLLELYLSDYKSLSDDRSGSSSELTVVSNKIMTILDSHSDIFDRAQALLLTEIFGFEIGTIFLLDIENSQQLLLRMYLSTKDNKNIFKLLKKNGRKEPEMLLQTLDYFVQESIRPDNGGKGDDSDDELRWDDIITTLELIESLSDSTVASITSPMQIVSILSQNKDLPISMLNKFIKSILTGTRSGLDELMISVSNMQTTVESLSIERQAKKEKGTAVAAPSDPTAIRKKAREAQIVEAKINGTYTGDDDDYDDDAYDDVDNYDSYENLAERQEQLLEQRKWEAIRKGLNDRSGDHENFFSELERSSDGFATIAGYFSKVNIV